MRYRHLLSVTALLCAQALAQGTAPPAPTLTLPPAAASTAAAGYRDPLSSAADDAQRFRFRSAAPRDDAPPDRTPTRVIINNGHGPHINCVPMGPGAGCH